MSLPGGSADLNRRHATPRHPQRSSYTFVRSLRNALQLEMLHRPSKRASGTLGIDLLKCQTCSGSGSVKPEQSSELANTIHDIPEPTEIFSNSESRVALAV